MLAKMKGVFKTFFKFKRTLRAKRNLGATGDSWKDPNMPEEQLKIVEKELALLHAGNPPSVHAVVAEALNTIPGNNKLTLLDVGCASGYYSEVISTLIGDRFDYTGADYSEAMLDLARKRYPDTKFINLDTRQIDLPDRSYDVVLCGGVITHIKEWKEAVKELTRITWSYLILHRTPITDGKSYGIEQEQYKVPVFSITFSRDELVGLTSEYGFKKIFEKNVYLHEKMGLGNMTYVFERVE